MTLPYRSGLLAIFKFQFVELVTLFFAIIWDRRR